VTSTGEWEAAQRLQDACDQALADEAFKRAPTLSRLLSYLVENTISGSADQLKSFTVGTEGLGRSIDQDDVDSYARVQVTRLRKTLDAYQFSHSDQDCLAIEPGGYAVSLVPGSSPHFQASVTDAGPSAFAERQTSPRPPAGTSKRLRLLWGGILGISLIGGLLAWRATEGTAQVWEKTNFPTLSVVVHIDTPSDPELPGAEEVKKELLDALAKYDGLRPIVAGPANADYEVELELAHLGESGTTTLRLINMSNHQLVFARTDANSPSGRAQFDSLAEQTAFEISNPAGILPTYGRRLGYVADSPYGCWLRFTDLVLSINTVGDDQLENCAADWYHAAPNHPVAAMLYGWTLTDRSIIAYSDTREQALLDEAISVLDQARTTNQKSAPLRLAAMRAHSFGGEVEEMREAGQQALAINPSSPDVRAMVGMTYIFWDIPLGRDYLKQAIGSNPNPPGWYHVGLAVDAMMRDDLVAMKRHIAAIDEIDRSQPVLQILFAAYQARSGNVGMAKQYLEGPPFKTAFGHIPLEWVLRRLPIAPSVHAKLKEWLKPAL